MLIAANASYHSNPRKRYYAEYLRPFQAYQASRVSPLRLIVRASEKRPLSATCHPRLSLVVREKSSAIVEPHFTRGNATIRRAQPLKVTSPTVRVVYAHQNQMCHRTPVSRMQTNNQQSSIIADASSMPFVLRASGCSMCAL